MQNLTEIVKSSLHGRLDIALIDKITLHIVKGLEEAYKPDINSDERTRLVELLTVINEDATLTCPRYSTESTLEDCKGCRYDKEDGSCDYVEREADYLLANGAIVPPCKLGDDVYFYKAELNEVCPAKVVGIYYRLHTPSMPLWIDISYESKTTGRQGCEMTSDVFKLLCHSTKEEAEAKLKEGVQK